MSEDLSAIQGAMAKKGRQSVKNRKRRVDEDHNEEDVSDDGADHGVFRKAKNPGSVYFQVLFRETEKKLAKYSADRDTKNDGVTRHVGRQEARRILYNRGRGNGSELKKLGEGITMATAFKKDENDDEVKEFPGARMKEVRKQTKEFIKKAYPEIWTQFDKEDWTRMDTLARDAFEEAYELWSSAGAEKSDEDAGSRKVSQEDLGPDDKTDSDEDTKIKVEKPVKHRGAGGAGGVGGVGGGFKVLGIVGLEQVPTAKVVASFPPGAPVPKGMFMATAVEQSGPQDKGRESAKVKVKKELDDKKSLEELRKEWRAMPSSGTVITLDSDSD